MEIKNYFAQDAQGNIMPSANCYLYLPGTTTLATGLVDGSGIPISNPFLASGMGQITFGAPNGVYDLRVALGARDWTIKVQCADIVQAMDVTDSILGSHAENPTTRNNGQPLEPGDETWNSTDKQPYWWSGTAWVALNSSAQSLEESLRSEEGSEISGFVRTEVDRQIENVGQMLSAGAVQIYEFAELAVGYIPAGNSDLWDWKPAILAACAKGPIVTGGGRKYRTSNILIPYTVDLREAWFLPHSSVTGQHLVTMTGADSKVNFGIDADGKGIGGLEAAGDWITGSLVMQNVSGQLQATGGTQGCLKFSGSNCKIDVFARNLKIGTSTNTSIPRVATTDNTNLSAANNTLNIYAYDVQCGWVTTQENVRCETLFIDGVKDNGIYHLQGTATAGTVTVRNCDDEPVVAKQGLHIDNLTIDNCNGFTSLSGEAATVDFSVGNYHVISSDPTKTYRPLAVRAANVNAKARIGLLQGRVNLVKDTTIGGIFQIEAGSMERLDVEDINLEVHYLEGSTKILANMSRLKSFYIGNLTIRFVDDTGTLTFADKVDFRLPTVITGFSYIGKVTLISDSAELRIANVSHPLLQFGPDMELTTSSGPYIAQQNTNFPAPRTFVSAGVPAVGTWLRGDSGVIKAPFSGGVGKYRCIGSGAPGQWRASEWIVGRGLSGSRPTLTSNDVGVMYLDNTLNSNGKPVWWNGGAWVDSSGAVV